MIKKDISFHTIEKNYKIDKHTLRYWKKTVDQSKLVNKKENQFRKNRSGFIYRNFFSTEEEDIY